MHQKRSLSFKKYILVSMMQKINTEYKVILIFLYSINTTEYFFKEAESTFKICIHYLVTIFNKRSFTKNELV